MATQTNTTPAPAELGFASRAEAFTQARDAARAAEEGPALDAAAEAEYAAAEALIETPAATPAQIAEKVAALMEVHNTGGTGQDLGMKSIRRDLIALDAAQTEARDAWEAALAAYEAARAHADALDLADADESECEAAGDAAWDLLKALIATPAPDGVAMGMKARVIIAQAHSDWIGDAPDNPLTIARLLAGDWSEQALASLYIDGLRLSGSQSPILNVRADDFDPAAWLEKVEDATGARLSKSDPWNNTAFVAARAGADVAGAKAQLDALYRDHAEAVERVACKRDATVSFPPPPLPPLTPEERENGRLALIDALANLSAKGPDRDAMRDRIAEAATPWVLIVEERGTGVKV